MTINRNQPTTHTMSEFIQFRRKQIAELRPYQERETLDGKVSVSQADKDAGSPKVGDMIARNPKNHEDQWLVAKQYFEDNFEALQYQNLSQGVKLIEIERYEQINKHGYSVQCDTDNNAWGELIAAASALIQPDHTIRTMVANMPEDWSDASCLKVCSKSYKDRLVIAGAFIAAELDRLIYQECHP